MLSLCDSEAVKFQQAVATIVLPSTGRTSVRIDGRLFGRWLSKTICNLVNADGLHVPIPLIRHAFSELDDRSIKILVAVHPGQELELRNDHIGIRSVVDVADPDRFAFRVSVYGIPFILASIRLEELDVESAETLGLQSGDAMPLDRPKSLALSDRSIEFQWH